MFKDREFSEAWEADRINEDDNLNVEGEIGESVEAEILSA
jgi:hypothetical protein